MEQAAIMVTGGSGFIGSHLVRKLTEQHRTVVAVYRRKLPESLDRVYPVCTDLSSPELMAAPLRGVGTVVHLAWEGGFASSVPPGTDWRHLEKPEDSVNLKMLGNLVKAMERAGTQRIVLLSAIGAKSHATSPFLSEKYAAESLVINSRIKERIIIRTAIAWGGQQSNDRFLRSLLRVMRYPIYPVPQRRGNLAPIYVQDLATILASCCKIKLSEPVAVMEVHGKESYQIHEIFRIVAEKLAKGARIPLGGVLGQTLLPLLERERRTNSDTPKIQQVLGIGGFVDSSLAVANPLTSVIPRDLATFRDNLLK
ncbi:MAG: NAD-dependent epimerase/dehydratase family protein [Deltaproteobacteria bacterium]|nr:NAD-dependent epimerase/dehydratase family protein [Deltaproteobacteria bacterium]